MDKKYEDESIESLLMILDINFIQQMNKERAKRNKQVPCEFYHIGEYRYMEDRLKKLVKYWPLLTICPASKRVLRWE